MRGRYSVPPLGFRARKGGTAARLAGRRLWARRQHEDRRLESYAGTGSLYREIRELGLEQNIAELDAFGFTILEPGKAAPVAWVEQLRDTLLAVAERRTGVKHDLATGTHGNLDVQPPFKHQYILYYLLLEDPIFQQAICNPYLLALQTYMLGFDCPHLELHFVREVARRGRLRPDPGPARGHARHALHPDRQGHPHRQQRLPADGLHPRQRRPGHGPGSHRYARQPRGGEGADAAIPIEAPMGSLVVWNGQHVARRLPAHGGGPAARLDDVLQPLVPVSAGGLPAARSRRRSWTPIRSVSRCCSGSPIPTCGRAPTVPISSAPRR